MEKSYSSWKVYSSIFALGLAGGSIYIIPYIKFVFYDLQLQVTGMTNTQSAFLLTVMSIAGMFISVPIGNIVDKMDMRKCIVGALLATTAVTVLYAFTFTSYITSLAVWFALAVFTAFYWPAFSKILNTIGAKTDKSGSGKSGMSFGMYYAFNGISGAIINSISLWASTLVADPVASFRIAVLVPAASTTIAAIVAYALLDKELIMVDESMLKNEKDNVKEKTSVGQVLTVVKNPMTWIFAIVTVVGYTLYSLQGYFTPYLTAVVGLSPESSGIFAIIRTYVFFALAPVGGILADKVFKSTAKWVATSYGLLVIIVGGFFLIPEGANVMLISFYTLLPSAFVQMTYTIRFSVINEIQISPLLLATTTSVLATVGSIVDIAFSPAIAYCIDTMGNDAYNVLFGFLMVMLTLGSAAATIIYKKNQARLKREALAEA